MRILLQMNTTVAREPLAVSVSEALCGNDQLRKISTTMFRFLVQRFKGPEPMSPLSQGPGSSRFWVLILICEAADVPIPARQSRTVERHTNP